MDSLGAFATSQIQLLLRILLYSARQKWSAFGTEADRRFCLWKSNNLISGLEDPGAGFVEVTVLEMEQMDCRGVFERGEMLVQMGRPEIV